MLNGFPRARRLCRYFLNGVPVDPSGAVRSISSKLDVLFRVSKVEDVLQPMSQEPRMAELAAAAVAACGGLCAFTSLRRAEVLAAFRRLCAEGDCLLDALGRPHVLQRAEQMLPGACATLMLTVVEAHLAPFGAQLAQQAAGAQLLLAADCAVLSGSGPQLGPLPDSVWQVVVLMLPSAAAYTVGLADRRPCALAKKCLLAALLKVITELVAHQLKYNALQVQFCTGPALESALEPCLQLTLHFEQLLLHQHQHLLQQTHQQQQQQQQQHVDLATALANCLSIAVYAFPLFTKFWEDLGTTAGNLREHAKSIMQLHIRTLQLLVKTPLCVGNPWPLVCGASGRIAIMTDLVHNQTVLDRIANREVVDWSRGCRLPAVQQCLERMERCCSKVAELSAAQPPGASRQLGSNRNFCARTAAVLSAAGAGCA